MMVWEKHRNCGLLCTDKYEKQAHKIYPTGKHYLSLQGIAESD
jgi:hypothetical protein